ncbi:hypothetical protein PLESTF_001330900 [Pleodorina starrii]|nr:hypothetical protein PLESTM_000049300 [Pleodorina starrii]GLC73089.1 hypothetical protein PLESTF_001330900 [Pleodorina starrii]
MTATSATPSCALCGAEACMECIACIRAGSSSCGLLCGASCFSVHFNSLHRSVHRGDDFKPSSVASSAAKPSGQQQHAPTTKPAQTPPRVTSRQHYGSPSFYQNPLPREAPHPRATIYRGREGLWSCSLAAHAAVVQPSSRHVSSTVLVKQR